MIQKIRAISSAINASRCGCIAAGIFAAVTLAASIIDAFALHLPVDLPSGGFLDAAIFASLSFGISRYSRISAALALILYLFEEAVRLEVFSGFNFVVALLMLALFYRGLSGTLAYHRLEDRAAVSH